MKQLSIGISLAAIAVSFATSAAPSKPSIDVWGSNNLQFSKIELAMETTSGYDQMVQYKDLADIQITFNQWSGTTGDAYNIYFDGVNSDTLSID